MPICYAAFDTLLMPTLPDALRDGAELFRYAGADDDIIALMRQICAAVTAPRLILLRRKYFRRRVATTFSVSRRYATPRRVMACDIFAYRWLSCRCSMLMPR